MPSEALILDHAPYPVETCLKCNKPFRPFLRGMVQRSKRFLGIGPLRPYCAIICQECKQIIGYEDPTSYEEKVLNGQWESEFGGGQVK